MFRFPLTRQPKVSREPFSVQTLAKASRLRGATVTESVCPYCAVGCGQLIFSKGGELIDIEGDPDSPISGGHLCPNLQPTHARLYTPEQQWCVGVLIFAAGILVPLGLLLFSRRLLFIFGAVIFLLVESWLVRFVYVKIPHASPLEIRRGE